MSTGERDPFLAQLQGAIAQDHEVELLEGIASALLHEVPSELVEQWGFESRETSAQFVVTRSMQEEGDDPLATLAITLGYSSSPECFLALGYIDHKLVMPDEPIDNLFDTVQAVSELLQLERLNPITVETLQRIKAFSHKLVLGEQHSNKEARAAMHQTIITLSTQLLDNHAPAILRVKEYSARDEQCGEELTILSHQLAANRGRLQQEDLDYAPLLQIEYYAPERQLMYYYTIHQDGERSLEIMGSGIEFEVADNAGEEDEFDHEGMYDEDGNHLASVLDDQRPRSEDVAYLIGKLSAHAL